MNYKLLSKSLLIAIPLQLCSFNSFDHPLTINTAYAAKAESNNQVTLKLPDGSTYQGEVQNGQPHGKGTQISPDKQKYVGDFVNGQREGQGVLTWPNGEKYSGSFKNGVANGDGVHTLKSGDTLSGVFVNGYINGALLYTWTDGRKYEGACINGAIDGIGKITHKNGKVQYTIFKLNQFLGEYQIIPAAEMKAGRAEWLGKTIAFTSNSIIKVPGDQSPAIDSYKLSSKRFIIKGLIKCNFLSDTYYLQLEDKETGETFFTYDRGYDIAMGLKSSYSSTPERNSFAFQNEIEFPPNYVEVPANEIFPYKANWIGQKITIYKSNPTGFSGILQSGLPFNGNNLTNKPFKIIALYTDKYNSNYYWKLFDEDSGEIAWYQDKHYALVKNGLGKTSEDEVPFYVETEKDTRNQITNDFNALVGRSIWADNTSHYLLRKLDVKHLERLIITEAKVDSDFKGVQFSAQREDGTTITWKQPFNKYLNLGQTPESVLDVVAFIQNPYELYDLPDGTWEVIRNGGVRVGFSKEMCLMSWGKPKSVNKTTNSWGVYEQWVYGLTSYLYFTNGELTTIQN